MMPDLEHAADRAPRHSVERLVRHWVGVGIRRIHGLPLSHWRIFTAQSDREMTFVSSS
jgi:hypothetical protein